MRAPSTPIQIVPHLLGTNQFFTDPAGYARTHPDAALDRWWPAARCQQTRRVPDGHGIWTNYGLTVPFIAEFDNNTMPLGRLVDKIDGYTAPAKTYDRV